MTYTVAGQAVANRVQVVGGANTLYYLYSDHLGSTVAQSSTSGTLVSGSLTYCLPYGSYRGTAPTQTLTDRDFTGQKENRELGLVYYNARYYVLSVGRFLSADTLIPSPTSPQSFNRYSYVRNSPINRVDPTGHLDNCATLGSLSDIHGCNHNYYSKAVERGDVRSLPVYLADRSADLGVIKRKRKKRLLCLNLGP